MAGVITNTTKETLAFKVDLGGAHQTQELFEEKEKGRFGNRKENF